MLIRREETVAILVDYQDKIVNAMYNADEVMKNSKILIKGLRILGIPMCKSQQYTKGLGMTNDEINEVSGLSADNYYDKASFSAYECTSDFIKGKKFVLVSGVEAHVCVLQTAIQLKENGYTPVLITDCIGSRTAYNHKAAIRRAKQEGILTTSYESVLFELLASAKAAEFREISNLVK